MQAQFLADFLEPVDALAQAVQQGQLDAGVQDLQDQAGKPAAGAHVDDLAPVQCLARQERGAVQEVEPRHLAGVCDGGEIHHLVFLQQAVAVQGQPLHRVGGIRQAQAVEPLAKDFQCLFRHSVGTSE